jgi:hypothetical protein
MLRRDNLPTHLACKPDGNYPDVGHLLYGKSQTLKPQATLVTAPESYMIRAVRRGFVDHHTAELAATNGPEEALDITREDRGLQSIIIGFCSLVDLFKIIVGITEAAGTEAS